MTKEEKEEEERLGQRQRRSGRDPSFIAK